MVHNIGPRTLGFLPCSRWEGVDGSTSEELNGKWSERAGIYVAVVLTGEVHQGSTGLQTGLGGLWGCGGTRRYESLRSRK